MRDNVLYFLLTLGKYRIISHLYLLYYKLGIQVVTFILKRQSFIESAYLKGSFGKNYFIPVISDLDFFIYGETNEINKRKLESIFKFLNLVFPIISDYDFHNQVETDYLRNHAGLKFVQSNDWKTLMGTDMGQSYKFHPRKYHIDTIHEIYFQLEWLFKNLRKRSRQEKFISCCIQRQYQKIFNLLHSFYPEAEDILDNDKIKWDKKWFQYTNKEIIQKFNKLIGKNERLKDILTIYQRELWDIDLDEILKEDYYLTNLVLIDEVDYEYKGRNHYLTKDLFSLFFYVGCIDSYLIWDWIQKSDDQNAKVFFKSLYYARLIEKRKNSRDDESSFYKNYDDAIEAKNILHNNFVHLKKKGISLFGESVFVIPLWRITDEDKIKILEFIEKSKLNVNQFKILFFEFVELQSFNSEDSYGHKAPELIEHIQIPLKDYEQYDEYQNQTILKMAIDWCFGAKTVISWDYHIEISNSDFFGKLKNQLIECDFVVPYNLIQTPGFDQKSFLEKESPLSPARNFLWAAKKSDWDNLGYIMDINLGLLDNELFYYTLTGNAEFVPDTEKVFHPSIRAIATHQYCVKSLESNLMSSEILNERDELNFTMCRSILFYPLLSTIKRGGFNLWVQDNTVPHFYMIEYFLENFSNLSSAEIFFQLKEFDFHALARFGQFFYLCVSWDFYNKVIGYKGNYAILEDHNEGFIVTTGRLEKSEIFSVFYKLKIDHEYAAGLYRVSFSMEAKNGFDDISLEAKLKPNGVECENPTEIISQMASDEINLWAELSPDTNYILFEAKLNLSSEAHFLFKDWQLEKMEKNDNEIYFRKVNSDLKLGEFHRGRYRLVVNFKDVTNGKVGINYQLGNRMPFSKVVGTKIAIVYLFINEVSRHDLKLVLIEIDENEIESIDIFKY